MAIDTTTRFQQVKGYLLDFIRQNQLKRNDQLPSESQIAKELGVSRNTLREAYISLENQGIIVRRHGIGTFVAQSPMIQDSLNEFSPFAQIIQAGGYTPSFQTLTMEHVYAGIAAYEALEVPPAVKLRRIRRLVCADDEPVIYVEDYIAPQVDQVVPSWDAFDGNMVQFLASSLDTPLQQIQSRIRAAALSGEKSLYLGLPEGSPILSVRSTIFSVDNHPITYSEICFNSNTVELSIQRVVRTR